MKRDDVDQVLERLLREPETYIADNGFTDRVLRSLPAPALAPRWRSAVIGLFAAAATAIVCFATPAGADVIKAVLVAAGSLVSLEAPPVWSVVVIALLLWGAFALTRMEAG